MRVTDTQFSKMMLQSLQSNNAGLGVVMQQMSTGDRLTKLSDDPMSSIKLLNLDRENSAIGQYKKNIANVKTTLSSQEVYLDSVSSSLKSMRDLVLWGANGSLTDQDRAGMVSKLQSLRDSVMSAMNAQDEEGHYLFSGTATDSPAIMQANGVYRVTGNNEKRVVTVAKGVAMEANMTAQDIINIKGGRNICNQIDALVKEFRHPSANFNNEIKNTLQSIDDTEANVLGSLTRIGGHDNNLDLLDGAHSDNKLFVDKLTSDLSALDYGEASVRLSNFMAALKATQASYMKIDGLSLFDRL